MADRKISQLAAIGYTSIGEETQIPIVVNNSSSTTNKIYVEQFAIYISNQIGSAYVNVAGTQTITGEKTFTSPIISSVTTGTAPLQVASTTKVTNLNADLLDGLSSAAFQVALSGTGIVKSVSGTISYITDNSTNWTTAYNDKINSAAVTGTTTKTLTLTQQDGGTITASWSDINTDAVSSVFGRTGAIVATEGDYSLTQLSDVTLTSPSNGQVLKYNGTTWVNNSDTGLTSVGISMPSAFSVSNSPLTSNGTIAITGAGTTAQYVRGDGSLATFPTIANEAQRLITEVYNQSGSVMTKGTIVLLDAEHGNLPTITRAIATGDATSAQTYGIVQNNIANMSNGYVVVVGLLENLDTRAYESGQILYLSSTIEGEWTTEKQYAPAHLVYVGIVVRVHPTQGSVAVKIQNGYEMDELHNVSAQSPNNGDILKYVSSTGLWTKTAGTTTNITEGTNLYFTNARARAALSFVAGSGAYNSTSGLITIPTNNNQITNGAGYITSSALSSYLPLAGGTLTGALNGTSASFSQKVQVTGSTAPASGSGLELFYDGSYAGILGYNRTSPGYLPIAIDGSSVTLFTGSTARLTANSAGNVGIGLTAPSEKLEVQSGTAGAKIKVSNTGGGYATLECSSNATSVAQLSFTNQLTLSGGNVILSNGLTAGDLISTSYGTARIQVTSTTNSANSALRFGAKNASGTTKNAGLYYVSGATSADTFMSFAADDTNYQFNFLANGNVLIGTTTDAGYKLDVNGTARVSGNFTATGTIVAGAGDILGSSASSDYGNLTLRGGYAITTSQASYIQIRGYEGGGATQGALMFYTNNTERLRISQSGNVTFKGGSSQNSLTLEAISGYGNGFYIFNGDGGLGNGFGIYNTTTSTLPFFISNAGASTFAGSVKIGSYTTTQINALTASAGMVVFNTTLATLCFYDGSGWRKVSHSNM